MPSGDDAAPYVPPRDPMIGRALGEYVVRDRIGEGGFGAVYRAHQQALGREAVIKVLRVGKRADETVVRRFTAEAQVASRLDHPYAAHVYGFGAEPDGLLWIAMELVRGSPLDLTLAMQGPIKLDRFVPLFERVCEVVHTAHEQGIVHRDLKPANIMVLTRAGRLLPKLLDFGIAKVLTTALSPTAAFAAPVLSDPEGLANTAPLGAVEQGAVARASETGNEILGSPRYMAPEQWTAPASVDARTDLYALGAVAFEALTGKPAFDARSIAAMMTAHTAGPIPRLPAGFPEALGGVLAKVLAKEQGDRYATAIELAEAFRAAAGLRSEKAAIPALDRKVRDRFVERAPEPLADAIVAYESAENAHAARDTLWHIARQVTRWLALLALSCRSRVGAGPGDRSAVERRLGALRRDGLRDLEWTDLARELVRPFATRREAYPIPELVAVLFPHDAEPDVGALLERILRRQSSSDPSDSQLRIGLATTDTSSLPELAGQLAEVLAGLWFLTEYEIVVPSPPPRGGRTAPQRIERFRGSRRLPRATVPADGLAEHAGRPVVLDGEGVPVLVLWPLVQCESGIGNERELFLFDGPGRTGARLIAPRHAFEIHDPDLWDWFHATVFAAATDGAAAIDERPYRGLSTFTAADADLFYGREREIDTFVNRLRVTPMLAVVGPSGAGKSSFVQAGALPALGWRAVIMRPGASPLAALAARLGNVDAKRLGDRPELLGEVLLGPDDDGVVLVVDQLEELFTLCTDPGERDRFVRALAAATTTVDRKIRVVVTLRDDFLMRAEALAALRERLAGGLHLLGTPKRDDLLRILVEPARRAGYDYEDAALHEEMVDAVANQPGALALLSFTAAALWELRDRHFRQLTRKAYESIGGVGGALARHAEDTLAAMPADQRALVREAFRRLVTAEGTRAVLTRSELVQVLAGQATDKRKPEAVIEALVTARLAAVSDAEDGERLEVTHEALLSAWPRLVEWRREDAAGARMRDQLRSAARQWDERGRPDGLLWRGDALAEFQIWRGRTPGSLTDVEDAFTGAAQRQARRGRLLRRALFASAFAFMAVALAVVLWLNARAKSERARAVDNLADLYEEQGRNALLAGNPSKALGYLESAHASGARGPALATMIAAATRSVDARLRLIGHTGKLWSIAYASEGRRIVTASADGTARIWDARSGAVERVLSGHTRDVYSATFSPDDTIVATASWDGTVRLWDAATGTQRGILTPGGVVKRAVFDPTGARLATAGANGAAGDARIWDVQTGAQLVVLTFPQRVVDIAWSHDGTRVVTSSHDQTARVWDAATGAAIVTLAGHTGVVTEARFLPDDATIVTASADGTAAAWDARTGKLLVPMLGHTGLVSHVEVSSDGKMIVTASLDKTARSWDVRTGRLLVSFEGHHGLIHMAKLSPDDKRLLTTSGDGTARIWDVASGAVLAIRDGHRDQAFAGAFRGDGAEVATASWDGTACTWSAAPDVLVEARAFDGGITSISVASSGLLATTQTAASLWRTLAVTPTALPIHGDFATLAGDRIAIVRDTVVELADLAGHTTATLRGHTRMITTAVFSPDGATLATSSEDGTARTWNVATHEPQLVLAHAGTYPNSVAFSPDGGSLATVAFDGTIRAFDARDGSVRWQASSQTSGFRVVYSPDGGKLVTAHIGIAIVWDGHTGALARVLEGHGDVVLGLAFSHDGALLATASEDKTVRVWDAERFELIQLLQGHRGRVVDVAFSLDDRELLTGSDDGTLRRWRFDRRALE